MLSHASPFGNTSDSQSGPSMPTAMPSMTTKPASAVTVVNGNKTQKYHHIWVVTGPAGCGKSTLAKRLRNALNWPYIEGDEYHPKANVEKMSNGIPLNDEDRWDWLTALREEAQKRLSGGAEGVILTCSALKKKYRDVMRVAGYYDHSLMIHFIYLKVAEEQVMERVRARENHYMGADMVHSQFEALEPPEPTERDSFTLDANRPADVVFHDALKQVTDTMSG